MYQQVDKYKDKAGRRKRKRRWEEGGKFKEEMGRG
jgi:hypothetical protein